MSIKRKKNKLSNNTKKRLIKLWSKKINQSNILKNKLIK